MDFAWLAAAVVRRWLVLALCLLAGAGGGYYLGHSGEKVYQAKAETLITLPTSQGLVDQSIGQTIAGNSVQTYARVATSTAVAQRVVAQLGLSQSAQTIAGMLSATAVTGTYIIDITAQNSQPVVAARIANAAALGLEDEVRQLESGKADKVQAQLLEPATVPQAPVSPRPTLNLIVGVLLGLVAGIAAAAAIEALDRSIKSAMQAETAFASPMLTLVPRRSAAEQIAFGDDRAVVAGEPYRALRTSLLFADPDHSLRTVLVTSATPDEGKSTTAANLAMAMALAGERVILIDADLRRAGMAALLGIERSAGLTSLILGRASIQDVLQPYGKGLQVLATGPLPPNPSEILGSQVFNRLLAEVGDLADIVIIDAPPILPVADAVTLAVQVDAVVLVARYGSTQRHAATEARRRLDAVGARIIGFVYNAVPAGQVRGYYADYAYSEAPRDPAGVRSDTRREPSLRQSPAQAVARSRVERDTSRSRRSDRQPFASSE